MVIIPGKSSKAAAEYSAVRESLRQKIEALSSARAPGAQPVERAAPAKHRNEHVVDMWLMDTGCGHDLVSRHEIRAVKHLIRRAGRAIVLHTANDKVNSTEAIDLFVRELE